MVAAFSGPFVTADLPGGKDVWKITEAFAFLDRRGRIWSVKEETITDCASIPRLLWPVVGHPRSVDIGQAAALHDVNYRSGRCSRWVADVVMYQGMICLGSSHLKATTIFIGLRLFGWWAWMRYKKKRERVKQTGHQKTKGLEST